MMHQKRAYPHLEITSGWRSSRGASQSSNMKYKQYHVTWIIKDKLALNKKNDMACGTNVSNYDRSGTKQHNETNIMTQKSTSLSAAPSFVSMVINVPTATFARDRLPCLSWFSFLMETILCRKDGGPSRLEVIK